MDALVELEANDDWLLPMLSGWKRVSDASADDATFRDVLLLLLLLLELLEMASDVEWLAMRLLGRLNSFPAEGLGAAFADDVSILADFLARGNGFRIETSDHTYES